MESAMILVWIAFAMLVAGISGERGNVEQFGGLSTYVSGPADAKAAVVLVTDVFGYKNPNLREIADKVAAAGFYVVAPDFLHGDPYVQNTNFTQWIPSHDPAKGIEDAKPVIAALQDKGITKIGAVGFCWGAKTVLDLSKIPSIEAAVLLHPSLVKVEDFKGVKVPLSLLGAENDTNSPPELIKKFEAAVLQENPGVDIFVKIFPGTKHGWSLMYHKDNATEVKNAEEAHKDLLDWMLNDADQLALEICLMLQLITSIILWSMLLK